MYPGDSDFPDFAVASRGRQAAIRTLAALALCAAGLALAAPAGAADDDAAPPAATAQPVEPSAFATAEDARDEPFRPGREDGDADAERAPAPPPEVASTIVVLPESAESRQVCRNVRVTGTRLPQRRCLTVAERDPGAEADEETARRILDTLMERSTRVLEDDSDTGLPGF